MKKTTDSVLLFSLHPPMAIVKCLLAALLLFSVTACALGPRMFNHSFSFDTIRDSADGRHPDIEVIDYQYGSSRQFATLGNREMVSLGQTFKAGHNGGPMQRGEFLYVKWRELATGAIYEDRVDLRERLPRDLDGLKLHFFIHGSRLYVFLIYPWDGKPWARESPRTEFLPIPGGVKRYQGSKYVQIYPDPLPVKSD